jgi:hypothetical protein
LPAAAATTSYLTAYMLIHNEGQLKAGDVLLAHGAGGGTKERQQAEFEMAETKFRERYNNYHPKIPLFYS